MKKRSNKGKSRLERTRGEGYEPVLVADKPKRIKIGRPSTFREELIDEIADRCRHGATDSEIMLEFGIANSTLYRWREMYPEFAKAMDEGKAKFDERVVRRFVDRAAGFSYMSEKAFSNGTRVKVVEYVPPDPGAAKIWLTQRGVFKPDSVLGELGLNPGDLAGASQAEIGVRALAIGALALLGAAAHNSQQPATIDVTPNRQEETDDDEETADLRRGDGPDTGEGGAAEVVGREPDDRDPDFDF
jgi:hypothetical protein